ncbi:hypothetical protein [Acetobacter thailandicus]|uniref:hypothetical protein n=1 Tax=Acetobacter thailandicus TaxID=1502842 RepID=UPI001BA9C1D0|nr:hypothetical protein [Acetobacter thailandicus]MBS1003182.1 hypothetical protein [Acetobacter thailandicus]
MKNYVLLIPLFLLIAGCENEKFGLKMDGINETRKVFPIEKEFVIIDIDKKAYNIYTRDTKDEFKDALDDALIKSGIFDGLNRKKANIIAEITNFSYSNFMQNIRISITYYIKDYKDGSVIYKDSISTHVKIHSINGIEPTRRAFDLNIVEFIKNMENSKMASQRSVE